jgi:rhodanese-related sulfurtransferase
VLNSRERPTLEQALERELRPLTLVQTLDLQMHGAQVLDTRDAARFEAAHLKGSVNVGLGGSYATWCGTILDPEKPIVLIAEPGREVEAATRLGRIAFDTVAGYLAGGMESLSDAPDLIDRIERITAGALAEQLTSGAPPLLVDVRAPGEWEEERIDAAVNVPLSRLSERLESLPHDRHIVVHCATGYRSAIAAGLLERAGFADVADLVGGLGAWASATHVEPADP